MPRSWSERFGFGSEEESPAVNNFEEDYLENRMLSKEKRDRNKVQIES